MQWIIRFSGFVSATMLMIVLAPSLQSFHPAEAIRSSSPAHIRLPSDRSSFRRASTFRNAAGCETRNGPVVDVCDPSLVHVAITLDFEYLRGSIAAVHSILQHSSCPESIFFHFLVSDTGLKTLFKVYYFEPEIVRKLISTSVRQALEQPLNYARNYLADILEGCVGRVIYLDSDLVVVDDISKLWSTSLGDKTIGAPEYCHANFTKYFTSSFWSNRKYSSIFSDRRPCYFNTGVMVIDLAKWRQFGYTRRIERWMEIQKSDRIYELGSLPPFLLVFAGHVAPIDHGWNQHGLGGDNGELPRPAPWSGEAAALEWKRKAVAEVGLETAVPVGCSMGTLRSIRTVDVMVGHQMLVSKPGHVIFGHLYSIPLFLHSDNKMKRYSIS
ncbi:LOW QUALITY PROTEIN: hypothetical protein OSB04_022859, partial [Centaurea solstitialis]